FHGRDIFAPAAAHLLNGVPLAALGPSVQSWLRLERPAPTRRPNGTLEAHVIAVDRFGNLILDLAREELPARPTFEVAGRPAVGLARSYAEAGDRLAALVGSFGRVELAWGNRSAAAALGVGVGATVVVRSAG